MRTMYKITRTIDGKDAVTLCNFPYIRDARKRLSQVAAVCRGEITEITRDSLTAIVHGHTFYFAISK